jgi:hypothetical protein
MQPCHHNVPVGWNGNAINYVFDGRPAVTGKAKSRVGEGRVRAAGRGKPKHLSGKVVITGGTNRDLCGKKVISVRLENTGSGRILASGTGGDGSSSDRRLQATAGGKLCNLVRIDNQDFAIGEALSGT